MDKILARSSLTKMVFLVKIKMPRIKLARKQKMLLRVGLNVQFFPVWPKNDKWVRYGHVKYGLNSHFGEN